MEVILYKSLFLMECLDVLKLFKFKKKSLQTEGMEPWARSMHRGSAVVLFSILGPGGQRK